MRARRLVVAAVASVLFPLSFPPTTASAGSAPGPCHLHQREGETVHAFARRQIRCAVRELGEVPGGATRAICIARRESGLVPTASSPTGRYLGLFQHAKTYWPWRYDTYTRPEWELPERALNGRTNAIVTIRMVRRFGGWQAAGWRIRGCT
jgi:hypothetical protein